MKEKIDVMIVGAQKAGTTSLLRYLGEHPDCMAHPQKEFAYFIDEQEFKQGIEAAFYKYYSSETPLTSQKIIAKNAGLYTRSESLKKLKEHNPKCEIILILRNPVERAYSSYLMEKNYGSVKFDFSELPQLINSHLEKDESWGFSFFVDYGLYINYLKLIYSYFPKEQVSVVLYRDFKNSPKEICSYLFKKIGVDSSFVPDTDVKHNVTVKTKSTVVARAIKHVLKRDGLVRKTLTQLIPSNKAYKYGELLREANKTNEKHTIMDSEVRQFLVNFYKPYNLELEKLIGQDLSEWNK